MKKIKIIDCYKKIRKTWLISPVEKIKESKKKKYNRSSEKIKLRQKYL